MLVETTTRLASRPEPPSLLSISAYEKDHAVLRNMIDPAWKLIKACTVPSGLAAAAKNRIAVILCDSDVVPGSWKDVLDRTQAEPDRPHMILTSEDADEWFWAQALEVGVYDVLAKPFDPEEVNRIVSGAWHRWKGHWGVNSPIPAKRESQWNSESLVRARACGV